MSRLGAVHRLLVAMRVASELVVPLMRAWRTLEPADWSRVADLVRTLADAFPSKVWLQRLSARLLRAALRSEEAISVSQRALDLCPGQVSLLLEHGRALRQAGQREAAIAVLAIASQRGSTPARDELLRYGARSALPVPENGIYPRSAYGAFIRECPVIAPPTVEQVAMFKLKVAAGRNQSATLESLHQQTYTHWTISETGGAPKPAGAKVYTIELQAGAILDPHCLAWLNFAASETSADIIRADHDHFHPDGARSDPVLLPPKPDSLWTEGPNSIVRLAACAVDSADKIHHIPQVLLSLPHTPFKEATPPEAEPPRISVIIPSRDNPALLNTAITTLRATASRPDRVEVIIVDNGSVTSSAHVLLDTLRREPRTQVISLDEPFNWSRANNLGASFATGDALLFLNDDTAMQTSGWDRILAGVLGQAQVGLVGARMIYPDGTIQHGGFVFGMDNGPQHEGRWMDRTDYGPAGRWIATREAAGVTGAFMAIQAADFQAFGRFDEATFAVDFADLDLCLRVRTGGKAVVYCGAISLIHHESVSRGLNIGRKKRARMRKEWLRFRARWGPLSVHDPWYHIAWSRTGAGYDGLKVTL